MQDAVPVRLGEGFRAWEYILTGHQQRIKTAAAELAVLGLGGSATGTGLNTHPRYPFSRGRTPQRVFTAAHHLRPPPDGCDAEHGTFCSPKQYPPQPRSRPGKKFPTTCAC